MSYRVTPNEAARTISVGGKNPIQTAALVLTETEAKHLIYALEDAYITLLKSEKKFRYQLNQESHFGDDSLWVNYYDPDGMLIGRTWYDGFEFEEQAISDAEARVKKLNARG